MGSRFLWDFQSLTWKKAYDDNVNVLSVVTIYMSVYFYRVDEHL